jgi:hypothetical protein
VIQNDTVVFSKYNKKNECSKNSNEKERDYIDFTAKENSQDRGAIRLLSRGV